MRKSIIPQTPVKSKNQDNSQAGNTVQRKVPSSQSPVGKRKPIKVDLKLDHMHNEINGMRNFKQFLEEINHSTKELIKFHQNRENPIVNENGSQKRRNSFSLNEKMFKDHLNQKESQKSLQKNGKQTNSSSKGAQIQQKFQHKQVDLTKLSAISKAMSQKRVQISEQMMKLKQRILHSSMCQDKQFYDFTQINYGIKMNQIEQKLEISQNNLQQKERQKKTHSQQIFTQNNIPSSYIIRYARYQSDTKEGSLVAQYLDVKSKILQELKLINLIYVKFQNLKTTNDSVKFQLQQTYKEESQTNKEESQGQSEASSKEQRIHPLIKSVNLLKSQFQKFADIIKAYRALPKKKPQKLKNQPQHKNQPQDITALLYHKVRLLNKEILQKELFTTKNKISKLKHETQLIQNGIKQLQAFKALTLLRNKRLEQKNLLEKKGNSQILKNYQFLKNSHTLKQNQKNTFDDEVLRMILEHQFFIKSKALRIQTKFSGLQKGNKRSLSDAASKTQMNNFKTINILRKCLSQKPIFLRSAQDQINEKKQNPAKKRQRIGLQIVSNGPSPKKQTGSSAETNP